MEEPKWTAVSMDLTEGCNLACDYCFTNSAHKRRSLDPELGKRILDWWLPQCDKSQEAQVTFWGGEPLLEWELLKMLRQYSFEKAKEVGIRHIQWGGTTNGLLYTPDKVEWCVKNQSKFMISLDGVQEAHDLHRHMPGGKGSWKIVDHNVREALKIDPETRVRLTLSPEIVHLFYDSMMYFFEDLGVLHATYSPVTEADWQPHHFEILEEQYTKIVDYMIDRLKADDPRIVKHITEDAKVIMSGATTQKFNPCGAGSHYAGWSVDGFLFPCHRFNKHGLSSAERAKLPIILARPKGNSFEWVNQEWRREFFNFVNEPPKDCAGCETYRCSACRGGCYATNYDITGSIRKHDPNGCRLTKLQNDAGRRYAELIKENGLQLDKTGDKPTSCICYNMCYSEGTEREIITVNQAYPGTCNCFNTNYNIKGRGNTRSWEIVKEEQRQKDIVVEAARQKLIYEMNMTSWDWVKLAARQVWKRITKRK